MTNKTKGIALVAIRVIVSLVATAATVNTFLATAAAFGCGYSISAPQSARKPQCNGNNNLMSNENNSPDPPNSGVTKIQNNNNKNNNGNGNDNNKKNDDEDD